MRNENEFREDVRERWKNRSHKGSRWLGFFLLVVGGLLWARASGVIFPFWFFTWPMLLIGIGLFSGIRHGFRSGGWPIPIIVGGVFLAFNYLSPDPDLKRYIWPTVLVIMGLLFLLRPKKKRWLQDETATDNNSRITDQAGTTENKYGDQSYHHRFKEEWQQAMNDRADVIDATAVFGSVKKIVLSKNFKGGDATAFMGGVELNLSQADCNGKVMIDCSAMFGGITLIVPSDWDVQSDLTNIFGGIEDKRQTTQVNPTKVLYLDGTCIFGGIEIKSF